MPDRLQTSIFSFTAGLATDMPDMSRSTDFFVVNYNTVDEPSGAKRKLGGSTRLAVVGTGQGSKTPAIVGMYDFWRNGNQATFTQTFIAVAANGTVWRIDSSGVATNITGTVAIGSNVVPIFCVARDLLIICTSDNNPPIKYNQTGVGFDNVTGNFILGTSLLGTGDLTSSVGVPFCDELGGTPPSSRGMVFHINRLWAWGDRANPSRLSYGSSASAEDWTGIDTGSIEVEPEDGDEIVGCVSYQQKLFVFKGPNKGSIHIISGTAPTGGNAFSRRVYVRGIALQSHNSIVTIGPDIAFMSDQGIHSLQTTLEFGEFSQENVTRLVTSYFTNNINHHALNRVWGFNDPNKSLAGWAHRSGSGTVNNAILVLSYIRIKEEGYKMSIWQRECTSVAIRKNPQTRRNELIFGDSSGNISRQDTSDYTIDTPTALLQGFPGIIQTGGQSSYSLDIATPYLLLANNDTAGKPSGDQPISLESFWLRSIATGNWDVTATVTRDDNLPETYTFNQAGTGFILGTKAIGLSSLLGTGQLKDNAVQLAYSTPPISGEARAVKFKFTQGGLNQGAHLLEFGVNWTPTAQSTQATL